MFEKIFERYVVMFGALYFAFCVGWHAHESGKISLIGIIGTIAFALRALWTPTSVQEIK